MQRSVSKLHIWLESIGLNVNQNKTSFMIFTRKKFSRIPSLSVNNININFVTSIKFLGVYLDGPLLTWRKHVAYLLNALSQQLNIMKFLASTMWGAHQNMLILFYQSFIWAKILFAV